MLKIKNIIFSLLVLGSCNMAFSEPGRAEDTAVAPLMNAAASSQYAVLETYHLIQEIVRASSPKQDHTNEILELRLQAQDEKIKSLEREIAKLSNPEGNNTPSVVLAAVSVIITVLGVLIAILSIFGYTNIKNESIKSSQETAKATIAEIAEKSLQEATEKSLIKLIEKGRFDEIIQDSVSNISYRGISIPDGLEEEEKEG